MLQLLLGFIGVARKTRLATISSLQKQCCEPWSKNQDDGRFLELSLISNDSKIRINTKLLHASFMV